MDKKPQKILQQKLQDFRPEEEGFEPPLAVLETAVLAIGRFLFINESDYNIRISGVQDKSDDLDISDKSDDFELPARGIVFSSWNQMIPNQMIPNHPVPGRGSCSDRSLSDFFRHLRPLSQRILLRVDCRSCML